MTYECEEEIEIGSIVAIKLKKRLVKGIVFSQYEKPQFLCEKILEVSEYFFPQSYLEIIKFISIYYTCSLGEAGNLFIPFKKRGSKNSSQISLDITLSKKQQEAFLFLKKHRFSLLFGDTGSGKTEVYFKLFEEMINQDKTSIFLVPEISLTPQMTKRLKAKFGDLVAIWHSKVTKKKKEEILKAIYQDRIKIVMGARSSLFLPLKKLGLIVVDEEHDDSYKANSRPRYHARDMALFIGKKLNAKVVLGSATPSLNSYKQLPFVRLKETFFESKKEYEFIQNSNFINQKIFDEIKSVMDKNKQAIIFLPTRANFKYLICKECGKGIKCPFCDVGMSLHKKNCVIKCHYCNYTDKIPTKCPSCHHNSLQVSRLGTAEVTKVLSKMFPQKKVVQFDRDTVTTAKKLNATLKDFNEKKIDILVGTQMLSKGHDYHGVKLVVVFDIDIILNMADFRSKWRALSLLLQVGGRVGRKGNGKVLVQSSNKEFFSAYLGDFELFLKDELEFCKELYPPYKKLLKVLIAHKNREKGIKILTDIQNRVNNFDMQQVEIVGFGEAPISKIAGKYRFQMLLRSSFIKELLKVAHLLKSIQGVEIDIDPISFY